MSAVFRVEKQNNFTVMSNHHLKNHDLSLKAKGLLSQMLSLPDNWDYSLKGLAKINKESIDAIRTAVWELEKAGYIVRSRGHGEHGKFSGFEYIIYETPHIETEKSDNQEQNIKPDVGRKDKSSSTTQTPESLDTQGISPKLENPTMVKNDKKFSSSTSPRLDFPTLENPTSGNPTSEQLNNKYINYNNILNTQSISQNDIKTTEKNINAKEQLDGQTDFTQALKILEDSSMNEELDEEFEEFLTECELDCLPETAQPLIRAALEKMYKSPSLKINGISVSQAQVRKRLKMLDADILMNIYTAYMSANRVDKPIINRIGYLISMIYNNSVEETAEQGAFGDDVLSTIISINRGYEDPYQYLQSDNPMIRFAAEQKSKRENSG